MKNEMVKIFGSLHLGCTVDHAIKDKMTKFNITECLNAQEWKAKQYHTRKIKEPIEERVMASSKKRMCGAAFRAHMTAMDIFYGPCMCIKLDRCYIAASWGEPAGNLCCIISVTLMIKQLYMAIQKYFATCFP